MESVIPVVYPYAGILLQHCVIRFAVFHPMLTVKRELAVRWGTTGTAPITHRIKLGQSQIARVARADVL